MLPARTMLRSVAILGRAHTTRRPSPFQWTPRVLEGNPRMQSTYEATATSSETMAPPVDFADTQSAFKNKSTFGLWRSLIVFKACEWQWLVKNSQMLLNLSLRVFGEKITMFVMRHSFFAHFCAGEDTEGLRPSVAFLKKQGVGGILDYAAEADLGAAPNPNNPNKWVGDSTLANLDTPDGIGCRTYDYVNERMCDLNRDIFLQSVRSVHAVTPEGFAAIKLTALGNPILLERMSTILEELRMLFYKIAEKDDKNPDAVLSLETFKKGYKLYFVPTPDAEIEKFFKKLDADNDGFIDAYEWVTNLTFRDCKELIALCSSPGPLSKAELTDEELELAVAMRNRIWEVAEEARNLKVRVMIDAEQTYFQPAIDNFVLELQREYNGEFPTIFNTYQCYLKDSFTRCEFALKRSKRENFWFGAKLVRGAYMVAERARAVEMGYPSPIHDTIEDTHANYDAMKLMKEQNIDPATGGVYFGQLLGMMDHLTFSLGGNGYKAYKYLPYGPVHEVIPYLLRRAQENSDIMGGLAAEVKLLKTEIKRRKYIFAA